MRVRTKMAARRSGGLTSWLVAILVAAAAAVAARGDFASDEAECTDQLTVLLPCLEFVEGSARLPSPDCCPAAKTVVDRSFKCLCLLVKDRNQPGLGFKINATRAVTLPSLCNVPANLSVCPKLLKLPPGSPAAKEYYEFEEQIIQNIQGQTKAAGSVNSTSSRSSIPSGSSMIKMWLKISRETGLAVQACLLLLMALLLL